MYTLWMGSMDFPKTPKPFQNLYQKSDIKEVHYLGVLAHKI